MKNIFIKNSTSFLVLGALCFPIAVSARLTAQEMQEERNEIASLVQTGVNIVYGPVEEELQDLETAQEAEARVQREKISEARGNLLKTLQELEEQKATLLTQIKDLRDQIQAAQRDMDRQIEDGLRPLKIQKEHITMSEAYRRDLDPLLSQQWKIINKWEERKEGFSVLSKEYTSTTNLSSAQSKNEQNLSELIRSMDSISMGEKSLAKEAIEAAHLRHVGGIKAEIEHKEKELRSSLHPQFLALQTTLAGQIDQVMEELRKLSELACHHQLAHEAELSILSKRKEEALAPFEAQRHKLNERLNAFRSEIEDSIIAETPFL